MVNNVTHIQDGNLAKRRYHNTMAIFYGVQAGRIPPRKKTALETILYVLRKEDKQNENTDCNATHTN